MIFSPILLFAFNRPEHLQSTILALQENVGAIDHPLFIYCDGPKSIKDKPAVEAVRAIARTTEGFQKVTCIESEGNKGLANSIIEGVSKSLEQHDSVIVLEDDMLTSRFFLQYMREALANYRNEPRVYSIHGYNYPANFDSINSESFFKRGADCWGWATWSRAWKVFEPDAEKLLAELRSRQLIEEFDYNGAYPFSLMLKRQAKSEIDSWAIRWNASVFLEGGLTLNPKKSLVKNIGLDGSGVHCIQSDGFDTEIFDGPVSVDAGSIKDNIAARNVIADYLSKQPKSRYSWQGLKQQLFRLFRNAT
jgi:hypothetical protein